MGSSQPLKDLGTPTVVHETLHRLVGLGETGLPGGGGGDDDAVVRVDLVLEPLQQLARLAELLVA